MINIEELSNDITSFYYDWDPYEFHDIYEDYDMCLADTKEILSSKKLTDDMIYDLKSICEDIKNDNDKSIKDLFNRATSIVKRVEDYQLSREDDLEL